MRKSAQLDEEGRLVDAVAGAPSPGRPDLVDVDPGDLPLDGSYRWDEPTGAFVPAHVPRRRIDDHVVLRRVVEALAATEIELDPEVLDWLEVLEIEES